MTGAQTAWIVVGLGNPGERYAHTRHNVGFDVLTILSEKTGIPLRKNHCSALTGEGLYEGRKVILAQPQTFMNASGESVRELVGWYKADPQRLIVVYDDVDLPAGKLRIRPSGSAGTHNCMRSVVQCLGTSDFPRVRVGIGRPPEGWDLADYVLAHYPTAEARKTAFDAFLRAADAVLRILTAGVGTAMQEFNAGGTQEGQ